MEALKAEMAAIRKERAAPAAEANQVREVQTLKAEVAALKQERVAQAAQAADVNQTLDELNATVAAVKKEADRSRIGDTKFLLTGYGFASYTDRRTEESTFSAGFNPIFIMGIKRSPAV